MVVVHPTSRQEPVGDVMVMGSPLIWSDFEASSTGQKSSCDSSTFSFVTGCQPVTNFQGISKLAPLIHLSLVDPPAIGPLFTNPLLCSEGYTIEQYWGVDARLDPFCCPDGGRSF